MGISAGINGLSERLMKVFLLVFLFLQPFSRFAGVRNAAFFLVLALFVVRIINKKARVDFRDRTVQALFLLAGIAVLSSLLGPYASESLRYLRKDLLCQIVVFLVIASEYRGLKELKPVLYALLGGFGALTLLVILTNDPQKLLNWLDYNDMNFTRGYSLFATFYIPLAAAYLYSVKDSPWLKRLIGSLVVLAFALSVLNNHRSQVLAIALSLGAITLLARRFKVFAAGVAVFIVLGGALLQFKPDALERYSTLLQPRTYTTDEYRGWNQRLSIWSGTMDMIKERPLLGYGYGWKKISLAVRDGGFLERWDREDGAYKYFTATGYGSANPHNLVLQILFEVGALGLLAFVFFWSTVAAKALSAGRESPAALFLVLSAFGVLVSYLVINTTNGLWTEAYGNLMMAFAAITLVLHREAKGTERREKWSTRIASSS